MLVLDLTSPGHSRSKQMPPNERPYDFLSIFRSKFGGICKGFQITNFQANLGQSKDRLFECLWSKFIVTNERVYMTSYLSLVISLAISASVTK